LAVSDEPEVPPKMPTGAEENANGDEIKCQPLSAQSILRENHLKKNHRKEEDISAAIDFDLKDAAIGNESNGGERERTTALVSYGGDLKAEGDRPAPPKNGFCAFWDVYPLKVGKDRAKGIYAKIIKSRKATAEELLAGAVRYAAVRDSEDSQFTKHPSTWLNGGCWTDELKPPRKPKSTKQSFAEAAMTGFDGFLRNDGHE